MKGWLRELETFGFPVVAALNGTALGGGWEIALACHHRIAIDSPRSRFGLPEVTLGLMPGAGGVTRMVRLLGLQEAMPYLMEGKQVKPADALKAGLVQDLAVDAADMMAKARAWIAANPAPRQPWDRDNYRMPGGLPSSPRSPAFSPSLRRCCATKPRDAIRRRRRSSLRRSRGRGSPSIPPAASNRAT